MESPWAFGGRQARAAQVNNVDSSRNEGVAVSIALEKGIWSKK